MDDTESPSKKRSRPPSKKLSLNRRTFSVFLKTKDGRQIQFFNDDGSSPSMFSQALSGRMELVSKTEDIQLCIEWSHPDQDLDAPKSLPFSERNRRNDIRDISPLLLEKHYKAHTLLECGGCKKAQDIQPDVGGYLRVSIDYTWFRFSHVVMQYEHKDNVYEAAKRMGVPVERVDCSHLCGNSWCCNAVHMHFEEHEINMERSKCHAKGFCSGHKNHIQCTFQL